jgi:hypothetical protein
MGNRLTTLTFLFAILIGLQNAEGAPPLDYFLAVTVRPSTLVKHEVDLQGPFDQTRVKTLLAGPSYFCHAVGVGSQPVARQGACYNWYKIEKPSKQAKRLLSIRCPLRGEESFGVAIGAPSCLLAPAKRLTTGRPSDASEELSYLKGYRVLEGRDLRKKVELTLEPGSESHTVIKPAFLCVPAQEWHHHEHFPVTKKHGCLLVYELLPKNETGSITTIDQFGLNKLEASSRRYLLAPAKIVGEDDLPGQ